MTRSIIFTIPGIPTAWARARTHGKIHFTPDKQRAAMSVIQTIAYDAMSGMSPFDKPVRMVVHAYWPYPKTMSQKKRADTPHRPSRPDWDNVAKLVGDSLNGIVYVDDALVVDGRVLKMYDGESAARTVVQIEEI